MESPLIVLGALVGLLVFAAVTLSDRRGIFWLAFVALLVPLEYVDRYFAELPALVKWLPELGLTCAGTAGLVLCPGVKTSIPRNVALAAVLMLVAAVASLVLNGSSVLAFLVSQRGIVLFFAAAAALKSVQGIYDQERVHSFLVGAGVASGLVCVLQRLTLAAHEPDRVTGLFSLGEVMLFFHLAVLALVLSYWVEGRRVGSWNTALVVSWMVLSLAVGNQEVAPLFLALLFGYLFVRARARRGVLLATAVVLTTGMVLVFTAFYDSAYRGEGRVSFVSSILDPAYIERYLFGEKQDVYAPSGDLLRGAAVLAATREIGGDPLHLLIGRGPGATSESQIGGASGPLALEFPGIGRVTLSLLLGDTGIVGLLLYLLFSIALFRGGANGGPPEPRQYRLFREFVVLLGLAYLVYARIVYEPIHAWLLACLLSSPVGVRALAEPRAEDCSPELA